MYAYMNRINSDKKLEGILLYPYNNRNLREQYDVDILNGNDVKPSLLKIITIIKLCMKKG